MFDTSYILVSDDCFKRQSNTTQWRRTFLEIWSGIKIQQYAKSL